MTSYRGPERRQSSPEHYNCPFNGDTAKDFSGALGKISGTLESVKEALVANREDHQLLFKKVELAETKIAGLKEQMARWGGMVAVSFVALQLVLKFWH